MKVNILCNDGQEYWIDSEDRHYNATMSRIIRQCGGWVMLKRYGELGYCVVPAHIITRIRCGSEKEEDISEFDKEYRMRIE